MVTCYALLIYIVDDILNANDKLLNIVDKVEVYILVKSGKKVTHIDSPPLSIGEYSNNWYQCRFLQENNIITGRYIMKRNKAYKNGIP
jgi:hypothetical protein